jgi:hypothetical protein
MTLTTAEIKTLFGEICTCGTLLPVWEWAKRKAIAEGKTCLCATNPSQEDWDGVRNTTTPEDWRAPRWGVKQIMVDTGVARWYTNETHLPEDAVKLAASYTKHTPIDPLTGKAVLYAAHPIPKGERY